jgi:hypothetical protein
MSILALLFFWDLANICHPCPPRRSAWSCLLPRSLFSPAKSCILIEILPYMVIDIIGWIGSVMVVLAYGSNIYKFLASDSIGYVLLNIGGSACLIVNTLYHHAVPSAVVNMIWVLIALAALMTRKKPAPAGNDQN